MDAVRIDDYFINLAHVWYIQQMPENYVEISMGDNVFIKIEDMTLDEVLIKLGLDHL